MAVRLATAVKCLSCSGGYPYNVEQPAGECLHGPTAAPPQTREQKLAARWKDDRTMDLSGPRRGA